MRYFMYSPLDMSQEEAYQRALPHLADYHIVHVTNRSVAVIPPQVGQRPSAAPDTYLVRVEQDGYLRVVQKALN